METFMTWLQRYRLRYFFEIRYGFFPALGMVVGMGCLDFALD